MELTREEICKMNEIQKDIMAHFIVVCERLGLKYYMVHGSLLGTLKYNGFFPFDDDIDVAMPRKDYDIFLKKGQALLPEGLFLQSCKTEKEFPLAFAKIRNDNTAFVQTIMKKLNINQGIYIDIFPMDNYPTSNLKRKWLNLWGNIYKTRIGTRINYEHGEATWKKIFRAFSCILCPSWDKAVQKRADLYVHIPENGNIIMTGGKAKERGIPLKWFGEGIEHEFSGLTVRCPDMCDEYMRCIYGNYQQYNPAAEYMNKNGTVTVSAEKFSVSKSYKELLN